MLLLPPEAVMIALDTSGPMKADVFPTCCPVSAAQRKYRRNLPPKKAQRKGT